MQHITEIILHIPWTWFVRLAVTILLFRLLGGAVHDLIAEGMSWGVAIRLGLLVQLLCLTYVMKFRFIK